MAVTDRAWQRMHATIIATAVAAKNNNSDDYNGVYTQATTTTIGDPDPRTSAV